MTGPRDAGFVIEAATGRVWQRHGDVWLCLTENAPACGWPELPRPLDVFVWRATEHKESK